MRKNDFYHRKKKKTIHFYFFLTSDSDYFTLFFFSDKKNKTKHFHRNGNIFLVIENFTASHKVPCLPNANQISFLR